MPRRRCELTDEQYERIEPLLPEVESICGAHSVRAQCHCYKRCKATSLFVQGPRAKWICSRDRPARGDRLDASEVVGAVLPERPQMSDPVERAARGRRRAVGAPWSYSSAGEAS